MKKALRNILAALFAFIFAGCAGSPTFLSANSSVSADEGGLYRILLVLSAAVFLFVEGWLVYNLVRFRKRPDDDSLPPQIHGNNRLEITWTAIPLMLVGVIFLMTVRTVSAVSDPAPSPGDIQLHVIGHQWWWEFDYPELGIKTANELHIPTGVNVQIELDSVDVIHSFWVPQLSGKVDVIPGQTNHLWMRADGPGEYRGQCAEFCGLNHANMRIKVVAETPEQFAAWVQDQQAPPVQPQTELQKQGQDLVLNGICSSCHSLGDKIAQKEIGPNLTHLMSRSVFAGATYDLNEENLRRWLESNQTMKPGNDMSLNPKADEIDAIMAYLTTLK